jgi:2-keto-4-pentenoate hydratase/2-oxohepta-3-ene-1,7-dioic acid hydratase in catechol pathway
MKRPGKIICVGRNYDAHAREMGNPVPAHPLIFLKPPSAFIGPDEPIVLPRASRRIEHEAEIGVVIGRRLRHAGPSEAMPAIRGIVCVNDVTARDLQNADGQWTRAKGFDTFCPAGPEPVPLEGLDWQELEILCRVNGDLRQRGHARQMVFGIPQLLVWISDVMTLEPGDLIATGTPEGVGPLVEGDLIQIEIPGVGLLENPVRAENPA